MGRSMIIVDLQNQTRHSDQMTKITPYIAFLRGFTYNLESIRWATQS